MQNENESANLFIISAPSGTGKTSLVNELVKTVSNLYISVSHTTRSKRSNEVENKSYHFVSKEEFQEMISKEVFLEHACIYGNYYGTFGSFVTNKLVAGIDVILEIDWQGAQIVMKKIQAISIFLMPPSLETLRIRLQDREQDNQNEINNRLKEAQKEILHYTNYDYLIMNDDFQTALFELQTIVRCQRLKTVQQQQKYYSALQNF